MKLLSIYRSRCIWFINLLDFNPHGHSLLKIIPTIIDKYKFQKFPTTYEEFDLTQGAKFFGGNFKKEGSQHDINVDLYVFNWGCFADTRSSTNDSDVFLEELFTWITIELGLVPYQEILKAKVYLSELLVQTDKPLKALNPKLTDFANRLTSLIVGHEHHPIAFETSGIAFWTDPNIVNPPGAFKFERAENTPFGENRYYSSAPLQTDLHLKMLAELESILNS
jgi:hypothetical protein